MRSFFCLKRSSNPECTVCNKKGEVESESHPCCEKDNKPLSENKPLRSDLLDSSIPFYGSAGEKLSPDQVSKDSDRVSRKDFLKNVYGNLPKDERAHFDRKFEKEKKDGINLPHKA